MFYIWLLILFLAIVLEVITAEALVCIWFVPASLIALLLNQIGFSNEMQIFSFIVCALLCFITLRPIVSRYLRGNIIATNADRLIGQNATLLKRASLEELGELKIGGIVWNCKPVDNQIIEANRLVKILAIDGSKLIIKEIQEV